MKKLIIIGIFLYSAQLLFCQTNGFGDWIVSTNVGIEKHDKRLFNYSERETLLEMQPKIWGTSHIGIQLQRNLIQHQRFNVFFGLGLNYENATFLRPFDHSYFQKDSFRILRNLNRYRKIQCPISITTLFQVDENLYISGELSSNILLHRSIDHTENNSDVFPYTESTVELDEIRLSIGIMYRIKNFVFGLSWRGLNYQKIDKIIFNSLVKDSRINQNWEWENQLRFNLTVGYIW